MITNYVEYLKDCKDLIMLLKLAYDNSIDDIFDFEIPFEADIYDIFTYVCSNWMESELEWLVYEDDEGNEIPNCGYIDFAHPSIEKFYLGRSEFLTTTKEVQNLKLREIDNNLMDILSRLITSLSNAKVEYIYNEKSIVKGIKIIFYYDFEPLVMFKYFIEYINQLELGITIISNLVEEGVYELVAM